LRPWCAGEAGSSKSDAAGDLEAGGLRHETWKAVSRGGEPGLGNDQSLSACSLEELLPVTIFCWMSSVY